MQRIASSIACLLLVSCTASDGETVASPIISQQEALALSELPDAAVILDVRTPAEFREGHMPNAINIPYDQLAARLDELADVGERKLVVYCESGRRAGIAEAALAEAGFDNIAHLDGHMKAWRANGLQQSVAQ